MKIGDLVKAKGFIFSDYGIGIVIGKEFGGLKVYWPQEGTWCYTGEGGVKLL
jgi:hypothetical protein